MTEQITFLRFAEMRRRSGLTKSVLYRRMAAGLFPRPIAISERGRAWREDVIDAYNRLIASGASAKTIAAYCKSVEPHFEVRLSGEQRRSQSMPRVGVTTLERILDS